MPSESSSKFSKFLTTRLSSDQNYQIEPIRLKEIRNFPSEVKLSMMSSDRPGFHRRGNCFYVLEKLLIRYLDFAELVDQNSAPESAYEVNSDPDFLKTV
jgi:hypothetical protein